MLETSQGQVLRSGGFTRPRSSPTMGSMDSNRTTFYYLPGYGGRVHTGLGQALLSRGVDLAGRETVTHLRRALDLMPDAARKFLGPAPAGHQVQGIPADRSHDGHRRGLRRRVPSGAGDAADIAGAQGASASPRLQR
jgi:hypothetical protein